MSARTPRHGTRGEYTHHKCRCADCRAANADAIRRFRERRLGEVIAADDPRHGTYGFYVNHGCRCPPCKDANAASSRRKYARKRAAS